MQLASSRQDDPSSALQPLIDGPSAYLWSGAGAVLLVMILVFVVLTRARIGRRRLRPAQPVAADYFQPAGENAEITFEDPRATAARTMSPVEAIPAPFDEALPPAREKKPGPFAGLFARRKQRDEEPSLAPTAEPPLEIPDEDMAVVSIERGPVPEPVAEEPAAQARSPFAEERRDLSPLRSQEPLRAAPRQDYQTPLRAPGPRVLLQIGRASCRERV